MGHSGTLDTKRISFLVALMRGESVEGASGCANISRSAGYRLYADTEFQMALAEARDELFDKELAALKHDVSLALKTLRRNMGEKNPSGTQVRAASVWLSTAIELHKLDTIEAKLEELTALLQQGGGYESP